MSTRCTTLAWEHAPYKGSKLLVFLALCDFANREGLCWPSIKTVAAYARVEERYVRRCIREFELDEMVACEQGGGRGKTSEYHVWPTLKNEGLETRVLENGKPGFLAQERGASETVAGLTNETSSSPPRAGAREEDEDVRPATVEETDAGTNVSHESRKASGSKDCNKRDSVTPDSKKSTYLSPSQIRTKMKKARQWQIDRVLESENPTRAFYAWEADRTLPDRYTPDKPPKARTPTDLMDALERMKK